MFDLSKNNLSAKAEAGYEFELEVPGTFEKTGAFITVRGDQSPAVKAFGRRKFQEIQARQKMQKRKGKEDDLDLDEAEAMAIEAAVVRIISWKGIAEEGKELSFSKETAERVLKDHPWIREAVMEASSELANFTK